MKIAFKQRGMSFTKHFILRRKELLKKELATKLPKTIEKVKEIRKHKKLEELFYGN